MNILDEILEEFLGDELDELVPLPAPPRLPAFAAETVRPPAA